MPYRHLDAERIAGTIDDLHVRIERRFPGSGLGNVCRELAQIAAKARERAAWIARPIIPLRIAAGALSLLIVAGLAGTVARLQVSGGDFRLLDFTQLLESGINDLVLTGAAIWFLLSLETRIKRHRALAAIHEMRAIAHVIDMHQLTKAPETVLGQAPAGGDGPAAGRTLSSADLALYLDYCSEMLSLTGKVAVLYVQNFDDGAARDGVNDVEELTTGLSRKIWQKMTVVRAVGGPAELAP
jgi:hypothetical protein